MKSIKIIIIPKQTNKAGLCTIYFEEAIDKNGVKSRRRIASGLKVRPSNWSKIKARVLPSDPDFELKNSQLEKKYVEYLNTSTKNKEASASSELIEYLEKFIQLRIALGRKRTSYKEFITIKNRLVRFEGFRLSQGLQRLKFQDLTLRFSDDLILWMSSHKYDPNTIKKHFITLKTFVNHYYNRASEYPEIKFTQDYLKPDFGKVSTHKSPPIPLTKEELRKLVEADDILKPYPELVKVRDAFVFGCATGLRFSDLFRISQANIRNGVIYIEPTKTEGTKSDNCCKIPLNSVSEKILTKYGGSTAPLKIANQYYNRKLKRLFRLLGFEELVCIKEYKGLGSPAIKEIPKYELFSSHNARDTFITLSIKSGIDIPSIMEMTGHTKHETMKRYINLDDGHLKAMMNKSEFLKS